MELIFEGVLQALRLMLSGDREVWQITLLSIRMIINAVYAT